MTFEKTTMKVIKFMKTFTPFATSLARLINAFDKFF